MSDLENSVIDEKSIVVGNGNFETVATFEVARNKIEKLLTFLDKKLDIVGDVTVQDEIAKSREALENARMRLGVALTYHRGFDPWSSTSNAKRRK